MTHSSRTVTYLDLIISGFRALFFMNSAILWTHVGRFMDLPVHDCGVIKRLSAYTPRPGKAAGNLSHLRAPTFSVLARQPHRMITFLTLCGQGTGLVDISMCGNVQPAEQHNTGGSVFTVSTRGACLGAPRNWKWKFFQRLTMEINAI